MEALTGPFITPRSERLMFLNCSVMVSSHIILFFQKVQPCKGKQFLELCPYYAVFVPHIFYLFGKCPHGTDVAHLPRHALLTLLRRVLAGGLPHIIYIRARV